MNIKLHWIYTYKNKPQVKSYNLDYAGEDLKITEVNKLIQQAKRNFGLRGKQFILVAGEHTYYAAKNEKDYDVFYLGYEEDTHAE